MPHKSLSGAELHYIENKFIEPDDVAMPSERGDRQIMRDLIDKGILNWQSVPKLGLTGLTEHGRKIWQHMGAEKKRSERPKEIDVRVSQSDAKVLGKMPSPFVSFGPSDSDDVQRIRLLRNHGLAERYGDEYRLTMNGRAAWQKVRHAPLLKAYDRYFEPESSRWLI